MEEFVGSPRFKRYLSRLEAIIGVAPSLHLVDSSNPSLGPVVAIIYRNIPEFGCITGISYGLSSAEHSSWHSGRPELCITARTDDAEWTMAPAKMIGAIRGLAAFRVGQVICSVEKVSERSAMKCFLVAGLDLPGFPKPLNIDVGEPNRAGSDVINLLKVYPVHEAERIYIQSHGAESFMALEWDRFDVNRASIV